VTPVEDDKSRPAPVSGRAAVVTAPPSGRIVGRALVSALIMSAARCCPALT